MNKIIESIIKQLEGKGFQGYRVFVLHTETDKKFGSDLIKELRRIGFLVWDHENCILPGKISKTEEEKALHEADFIIAIMSNATKSTESRYTSLLKVALEEQLEKSDGGIKLISILIDKVKLPYEYRPYHPLDMTTLGNASMILRSFMHEYNRRNELGITREEPEAIWV